MTATPARRRTKIANLALLAASLIVVAPICGELALRLGILLDLEGVKNARLYAGWTDDDDCWKLLYRWSEQDAWDGPLVFDPDLGWTMGEEEVGRCDDCESPVLLYGDSFVFGVHPTPRKRRIPALLRRSLRPRPVLNYAVNGYGLDQIFLRFRATHARHREPTIVFGFMTLDLDRSVLIVRSAPKPYFRLRDGGLELAGVPVSRDTADWHRRHPPEITSYLLSFLRRRYRLAQADIETEIPYRRAEKAELNARILEALAREVTEHRLPLLVVVLYPPWELGIEGWRERFLKEHLERLGIDFIDTKPLLLGLSDDPAAALFHRAPNNHPNGAANRAITREIVKYLGRSAGRAGERTAHEG